MVAVMEKKKAYGEVRLEPVFLPGAYRSWLPEERERETADLRAIA